jgi:phage tail-like protein
VRRSDWLVSQLPMGMLDDGFFVRFVSLFEDVATSYLEGADNIPNVVDVDVAPPELVRWLASWIGTVQIDSSLDEALQRRLVKTASDILAWRGTRRGLEQFLAVVTGGEVQVEESGTIGREGTLGDRPPFVRMRVASIGWLPDSDFVALVRDEIPAHVTYELFVGDRQLWPPVAQAS